MLKRKLNQADAQLDEDHRREPKLSGDAAILFGCRVMTARSFAAMPDGEEDAEMLCGA